MLKQLQKLSTSQGLIQSLYTVFGNAVASGLSGIAMILISRKLGPSEFGEFSVGFSLILILISINSLGLNVVLLQHIPRLKTILARNKLTSYTLWLKLKAYLLISAAVLAIGYLYVFNIYPHRLITVISLVALLGVLLYEHMLTNLQALHRFWMAVVINLIQSSTKLFIALALFFDNTKSAAVALALYSVGPFIPALIWRRFFPQDTTLILKSDFATEKKLTWSIMKHSALGLMVVGISDYVDVLFVRGYLSAYETGLFGGVSKIAMFVMLFAYSLGNVLYPRVARYQLKTDIKGYVGKALLISVLAVLGFIAFIPFAQLAIQLTVGPEYVSAWAVLVILMAAAFLTIAIVPLQALFYSFEAPWYFSATGFIQLVVVMIGNGFFVPMYGLEAAAWTRLMSRVVLLLVTIVMAWFMYRKKYQLSSEHEA